MSSSSAQPSTEAFLAFARTSAVHIARVSVGAKQEKGLGSEELSLSESAYAGLKTIAFPSNRQNFVFHVDVVRSISLDYRLVSVQVSLTHKHISYL